MPIRFSLALALAALFGLAMLPASADAQGRGNSSAARAQDGRYDDLNTARRGGGPPFCQSGQGHPVHGRNWCVQKGFGLGSSGRYDDRVADRSADHSEDRRGSAYERDHADFHRYLDRKYNELAARRPLDVQYQVQLRLQKQEEHDEWHRRAGIQH